MSKNIWFARFRHRRRRVAVRQRRRAMPHEFKWRQGPLYKPTQLVNDILTTICMLRMSPVRVLAEIG